MPVLVPSEGEVLSQSEATSLTDSIRSTIVDLEELVVRAYYGRIWIPLGYESWDEYIQGEFKQAPLSLPREDRRTQVASLRQQGLSLRAIGTATGVSHPTVIEDLRGGQNLPPAPVTGIDGKEYTSTQPKESHTPDEVIDDPATCPTCGQSWPT